MKCIARIPIVALLIQAGVRGARTHAKDMAASIAFFTFLSLFPLLLGMISLAGSVLNSSRLQRQVHDWVMEFFPVGADFVMQNVESLVRLRGAAGLASVLVLFWSARKMVAAISRGVNLALGEHRDHAIYLSPLRNFMLALVISLLMFMSTALSPFADLLTALPWSIPHPAWHSLVEIIGGHMVGLLSTGTMLVCVYTLVPYKRPGWSQVWPGVLLAALMIELDKKAFVIYVENVSGLDALYGSISSIIVLLLWLYFASRALIYGALVNHTYNQASRGS